jgi:hypothetical protein
MKRALYGLLIAFVAYVALALTHTTAAIQALIALPGSAGLVFALWELVKANVEHQHRLEEKSAENAFILSATSHMAEKAFDKHVEFCEKYVAKANDGLLTLFRDGPTGKALDIANDLYQTRRDFVLWETKDVALILDGFEKALRGIGVDRSLLQIEPVGKDRTEVVKRLYDTFSKVVGLGTLPGEPTSEIAVTYIIAHLQDHLGVSQLTNLRKYYVAEAAKRMQ